LDDKLKHSNSGVVFAAIKLFITYSDLIPSVRTDVYQRIKGKKDIKNNNKK
jgi:hypothetical protein